MAGCGRVTRVWLAAALVAALAASLAGCGSGGSDQRGILTDAERAELARVEPAAASSGADGGPAKRVIILGIDGMDYAVTSDLLARGRLPHFKALADAGGFRPLLSSMPPQSPVAWSNFITGADPGVHGIFDFVHREPDSYFPYLSISEAVPAPEKTKVLGISVTNRLRVPFTDYTFPLAGGEVVNLRKGVAFWQVLEQAGVRSVIFGMPANFPPIASEKGLVTSISGMGTPDILGTYGTSSYYTTDPPPDAADAAGGYFYPVEVVDGVVHAELRGPANDFIDFDAVERRTGQAIPYQSRKTTIPFEVYVDPENPVVSVSIQGTEVILTEGEFSDFVEVEFEMVPRLVKVPGIVRFFLKSAHPEFTLYASPVQINPRNQALPITDPPEYGAELAEAVGLFYTQGMAEDTKALENGVFGNKEFTELAEIIFDERIAAYRYELGRFEEGLLYVYFSSLDQSQHAMWRCGDPSHPAYDAEADAPYARYLESLYIKFDEVLAMAMDKADENTTLIVCSDHGFAPWYRQVHLNKWLYDEGYLVLDPGVRPDEVEWLSGVDWSQTRAYAFGINGLYVNLMEREGKGVVPPGPEADALVDEIVGKLERVVDPKTGQRAISHAYKTRDLYHGPSAADAPDITVGYSRGYRGSDSSATGKIDVRLFDDNTKKWSGDHCADFVHVPGILFANRPLGLEAPALYDLAPTILEEFGVPKMSWMVGRSVFQAAP
jgi:predicted AlkP superfamily phosphohydrolase/phosphomutase